MYKGRTSQNEQFTQFPKAQKDVSGTTGSLSKERKHKGQTRSNERRTALSLYRRVRKGEYRMEQLRAQMQALDRKTQNTHK